MYSSGNPFKRPCPLVTYTQTKAEFLSKLEQLDAVREAATPPSVTAALHGKRAKQNREEYLKAKKLVAAKQTESKLADAMQNLLPEIEKHEQVSSASGTFADGNTESYPGSEENPRGRHAGCSD